MKLKELISHAKEYGFIFPSSEIYDGLSAAYDYGPNGVLLKNNLKAYWWKSMVQMHENIVGIDTAIFMHPKTWKASGHVDAFNDPLIDNKDSKKRYRADVLIEEHIEKIEGKIERYKASAADITARLATLMTAGDMEGLYNLIVELDIVDPVSGTRNWTEVRQFNLMFSTQLGNIAGEEGKLYLRPETAQGIFVNFLNVQKSTRQKIPFGIAQIGKAFRNEIIARQFVFRMREFEQMEMQFFVRPAEEMKFYEYWKATRMAWHTAIGTSADHLRYHDHDNLAHYANAAVDIQYQFPFGFRELEGIHSRTDFDLTSHQAHSGKKIQYFDPEINESYIPYVVETSIGLDRMFLAILSETLVEETVPDADGKDATRLVMKIHPALAPNKCAILPLLKNKPELVEKAKAIFDTLRYDFSCQYDEKDAIGRRYRRQDAIGTPYCITVDFDTLEDDTVTIRDRDTLLQERIPIDQLAARIKSNIGFSTLLKG
ncbi:UNVERIFIED_CONTAM: hypothetical protein GTU68_052425 [Idotea baltica]|nr:hypothetical protein [Idotea baltica]